MMSAAIYGRLGRDPKALETASGKAMAASSIAVNLVRDATDEMPPEWIAIIAFGRQADLLLRQKKGDLLSASGRVQRNVYTNKSGDEVSELQIIADSIVSARSTRPAGGTKKTVTTDEPSDKQDFDDEIPF